MTVCLKELARLADTGMSSVEAACELMVGWTDVNRTARRASITFADQPQPAAVHHSVPRQAAEARRQSATYTTDGPDGTPVRMVGRQCHGGRTDLPARKLLGVNEERALAHAWTTQRDPVAGMRLIEGLRPFIDQLLAKARLTGHAHLLTDLEQQMRLGILEEVDSFDPTQGTRLVTHLHRRLKAVMYRYLMDNALATRIGTNRADKKLWFRLNALRRHWERRHGRRLTQSGREWIAQQLGVPLDAVVRMERRMQGDISLAGDEEDRLSERAGETTEVKRELAEALLDPADTPEDSLDRRRLRRLGARVANLATTRLERDLVRERLATTDRKTALATLGQRHGVSRKKVMTAERKLIARMRAALPADMVRDDVLCAA